MTRSSPYNVRHLFKVEALLVACLRAGLEARDGNRANLGVARERVQSLVPMLLQRHQESREEILGLVGAIRLLREAQRPGQTRERHRDPAWVPDPPASDQELEEFIQAHLDYQSPPEAAVAFNRGVSQFQEAAAYLDMLRRFFPWYGG